MELPSWHGGKESACSAGDVGSIPEWGRFPGEGNGNPLQYSCLENCRDRGAGRAYSPWRGRESAMTEHACTGTSHKFPWKKKGGYFTDENTETLKMSVVSPKFRHNYLKEQKGKLRFFWHPEEVSDPSVPFPTSLLLPTRWVPCSSPHGPLTSSWWGCRQVLFFKWALAAAVSPSGLMQVHLPEFFCAARRGRWAFLQWIWDAAVSETVRPASRRGNIFAILVQFWTLGPFLPACRPLPVHLFSFTHQTPSEHSLRHSKGVSRLILSTKYGVCVSDQAWSSVLRIAAVERH